MPIPHRRMGANIDGKEKTAGAQFFIQLLARYTRLDDAIHITCMDCDNLVHFA